MDRNILNEYEDMKREYNDLKARIRKAEAELDRHEVKYRVTDRTTGGMGGVQHFDIRGITYEDYTQKKTELLRRKLRLEHLRDELGGKLEEVEQYIDSIEDSRKRLILRYKYVDGLSWRQTARKLGTGCTEDSVRMEIARFLKS
jgi:DNA repair exonuclease SbcCD ATPase subunit